MADSLSNKEICKVCVKKVIDKGVECDGPCKRWYHPECVRLPSADYKKIADGIIKTWHCGREDCKPDSEDSSVVLRQILEQLNRLASKDDVKKISNEISVLRQDITNLSQMVSDLEPRLTDAEKDINLLKTTVNALRKSASPMVTEQICVEVADRSFRKSNVILHNVAEGKSQTPAGMKSHDKDLITRLFNQISFTPQNYSFFRIGKRNESKPRPIKVILPNVELVKDFFSKLTPDNLTGSDLSNVTATRDKTLLERQHLDGLREELEEREKNGEADLTIKYVNGTPKIVPKQKN